MKRRIAKKKRYAPEIFGSLPPHMQRKEYRRAFLAANLPLQKRLDKVNSTFGIGGGVGWYTYDERTGYPKPASFSEYSWFRMTGRNHIKRTDINDEEFISTVCPGIDHIMYFGERKRMPVIFETMWGRLTPLPQPKSTLFSQNFRGLMDIEMERASTKGEALKHHNDLVLIAKQAYEQVGVLI